MRNKVNNAVRGAILSIETRDDTHELHPLRFGYPNSNNMLCHGGNEGTGMFSYRLLLLTGDSGQFVATITLMAPERTNRGFSAICTKPVILLA